MIRIQAPEESAGTTKFLDVEFHDGVATVDELHPVRELALIQHGYTVTHEIEGEKLESMTVPQLRALANEEGIDLPPKAKKSEIIDALNAAPVRELTVSDLADEPSIAPGGITATSDVTDHPAIMIEPEGGETYIPGPSTEA